MTEPSPPHAPPAGAASPCGHSHAHGHSDHHHAPPPAAAGCCGGGCHAPPAAAKTPPPLAGARGFYVANMDCPSEEAEIRHALAAVPGVQGVHVQLGPRRLWLQADDAAWPQALAALQRAGFRPQPLAAAAAPAAGLGAGFWTRWGRLLLALSLALGAEGLHLAAEAATAPAAGWARAAGLALAAAAIGLSGLGVYAKGLAALRQGRLNINALMSVAVTGAFAIGQWPEAAMVMALYALAEALEARAVDRARGAIQSLLALAPQQADVQQDPAADTWQRQPVQHVPVGALVRIRPGERVPLDGVIAQGHSALNESPVTGESLPVDKGPGAAVFAGSINQSAELHVRTSALASDSTLARIIHAVEQAQASRAPTQRWVDRFAAVYTPAVFALALAVALFGPWLAGWGWQQAIYKALVLLVIACPCALVISTPVTVVSGLTAAARRGVLIKGGAHLENARRIRALALDKTGTITTGQPTLQAFSALHAAADLPALQTLAKSLAARSDHPVAQALAAGLPGPALPVQGFEALPGQGVQGHIHGQHCALLKAPNPPGDALAAALAPHAQAGHSISLLVIDGQPQALAAVADRPKPHAAQAVAALRALGLRTIMLTGDHLPAAQAVAQQAGVDEVRAQLLPQDKLHAIAQLQAQYGPVAMAGDGINDAPALARADLGFAMGAAGTHTATEAADVVVMNDDLRRLPQTIALSRRTHAVLWQNISLALGIKLAFLLLALLHSASMWMAVFADMGASLLVVANGLRLLRSGKNAENTL